MYLYWWQWIVLVAGIDIAGALGCSIYYRAHDIHQQKSTHWNDHWAFLAWPFMVFVLPQYLIELGAQQYAKYLDYKRKKKLNMINKKVG